VTANPYPVGKVTGVEIYQNDVVVKREGSGVPPTKSERGEIKVFSKKSRERLAFIAANTSIRFTAMITLTYPSEYPSDGALVKSHFHAMLVALRRRAKGELSHLWFIEFQKRGAPHFHILARGITVDNDTRRWLSKRWYTIVGSNDTKHLWAGTRLERLRSKDGAAHYAVKYAYKMKQKIVPRDYRNIGRFWGHSKDVKPEPIARADCTADDVLAALELYGWPYLKGDVLWYKVLYGTSQILTNYLFRDILVPNTSNSHNTS